jgi:hypothetical protein
MSFVNFIDDRTFSDLDMRIQMLEKLACDLAFVIYADVDDHLEACDREFIAKRDFMKLIPKEKWPKEIHL